MLPRSCLTLLLLLSWLPPSSAFTVLPRPYHQQQQQRLHRHGITRHRRSRVSYPSSTQLAVIFDVPDYFFTLTFPLLSVFLAFSKNVARSRLEERAWEQRLEDARERQMEQDPSLTELDLRRSEAAAEWSAYGSKERTDAMEDDSSFSSSSSRRRGRRRGGVAVQERDDDEDDEDDEDARREYTMTDEEIDQFEQEFGVQYDPYYDDPYTEDELPDDLKFRVDKGYGDRIYEDGEVFYKDSVSGLYYRQGAQPRTQSKLWKL